MTDVLGIPDRPEAVTAEWLTGAFASSFPGTTVTRMTVLDQHSGTTGRMRIGLEYAPGPQGPATAFVKLPPFDPEQREMVAMTDMGRMEARFYQGPAAETPMRVPLAYFAADGDEPTDYVMVLEDLEASGCTFPNRSLDSHAEDNAEQLIHSLARHHAHFWDDPRLEDEWSWLPRPRRSPQSSEIVKGAKPMFAADFPPVWGELADLWIDRRDEIVDLWEDGPKTLIHCDTHNGNQFMDGDTVGLYDWAVVNRAPGIRDIAIYLGHSCPTELRRREQDRWLRGYHQVLVDSGVNPPSFDELWLRYRIGIMYSWVASTTTAAFGNRMQPIEISMRGMTLATTACGDLETVEAIREAL